MRNANNEGLYQCKKHCTFALEKSQKSIETTITHADEVACGMWNLQ